VRKPPFIAHSRRRRYTQTTPVLVNKPINRTGVEAFERTPPRDIRIARADPNGARAVGSSPVRE
jgi:hypothetical protein